MKKLYFAFTFLFLISIAGYSQVVINEVYGGGGNAGATYKNDFIELYNNSSAPVDLAGWSVQYNSAAGTSTWQKTNLSGIIPAHSYFLVQQGAGSGGTVDLANVNVVGTINMSGTAGKVALLNSITALAGQNPVSANIIDKVAFGSVTGGGFETAAAPAPSNTLSIQRVPAGVDTDNNSVDFKTGAPSPTGTGAANNTINVSSGSAAGEPAANGTFTIVFDAPTTASTSVDFTFGGSAQFGSDYSISFSAGSATPASAGTLTVPAGTSSVTVTVIPVDDNAVEGTENISLSLSNASQQYTTGNSATINIADNDVPPTVSVAAGTNAAEPSTNGTFTINLSSPAPAGGVTVNYTLAGTATLNTDFSDALPGAILVPEGSISAAIVLTVMDDTDAEDTENITVTLNSAGNGYAIATGNASINLLDNEVQPIPLTGVYQQNFNTLGITGTANTLSLPGWSIVETGGGARDNELYAADNGGSNAGDTYSYGNTASTERALGSVQSGSLVSSFGAAFINNTGKTINTLKIDYTGEQWRLGTADRADALNFEYSVNATDLFSGTWTSVNQLNFITPNTTGAGAKDGNDAVNRTAISFTIPGLTIPAGSTFFIRWNDAGASGADDGLAIDDLAVEANPRDEAAPEITSIFPTDDATAIATHLTATLRFNEAIQKGTGQIVIKKTSDNSVVKTFDVNSDGVTISTTSASFDLTGLMANTGYYIEVDAGALTDLSANPSAAITGNSWSFTTGTLLYVAGFDNCSSTLSDGFSQYSSVGNITWTCTPFGRDAADAAGTASAPGGVQMNGFEGGTNVPNIDWLISPSLDLTGTTYPLLSFYSRTAFNGLPLKLKVSTNYTGGDPANATWTDINGKFPALASNVWTLTSNVNLEAYKQSNVHFAFVYTSTVDDGARWTIDDISIDNSATPPPPSLTVSTSDVRFAYVAAGSFADKHITFTGNDLTDDITVQSTGDFQLSKDGNNFSSTVLYTANEANNLEQQLFVRFSPPVDGQDYTGSVTVTTSNLSSTVNLTGSSIDPTTTLEIVNWNIEWFGSDEFGPTNEDLQEQNIKKILSNTGADVYALSEVVDEARLARVVSAMPGYSYTISNFGSHTNTTTNPAGALADAQKLAFVYKTSVLSNVSAQPLLSAGINSAADLNNPAYNYWSSGRFPYMMTADVTLNCVTKNVRFILVHAKANTSPTAASYERRKKGSDTLYQTLQTLYPNDNIIILGDFNDDLDQSITAGYTTTSWSAFKNDEASFPLLTLPLSLAGKKSTVSYNDMIDHVVVSNEMNQYYMTSTASVLSDVTGLVSNYGSTTTDHYPVFTRYRFEKPTIVPTVIECPVIPAFCANGNGNYSIPAFTAKAYCGEIKYSYSVTGATVRNGSSNDASGLFNEGISTINWTAIDDFGNTANCQTVVRVNNNPSVTIADAQALPSGVLLNTVYVGYAPASSVTLQPVVTGGSPVYTYSWSNGSTSETTSVSPTTNTTYNLTVTDANGCQSTAVKSINVINVHAGNKLDKVYVCHGNKALSISSNAVATHLNHGDMLGNCAGSNSLFVQHSILPVMEENISLAVVAYPNPSNRYFTLNTRGAGNTPMRIKVFNIAGQVIEKNEGLFAGQQVQIGKDYKHGVYFAEITTGAQKVVVKLVKQ